MHGCLRTRINETSYNKSPTRKSGKKAFPFPLLPSCQAEKDTGLSFQSFSSDAQSFAQTNYGHLRNMA